MLSARQDRIAERIMGTTLLGLTLTGTFLGAVGYHFDKSSTPLEIYAAGGLSLGFAVGLITSGITTASYACAVEVFKTIKSHRNDDPNAKREYIGPLRGARLVSSSVTPRRSI